jgi:hypothetical protein
MHLCSGEAGWEVEPLGGAYLADLVALAMEPAMDGDLEDLT